MIIATAGHVDHGKTSLVKALTGIDTDRLPEEKRRNLTIDLGFAYMPIAGREAIGFTDVPGHERFIRNALCGLAGADFVLLVVAADDGLMPQTREHLAIVDLLGIGRGAVAITKIDRVSQQRLLDVSGHVAAALACTALRHATIFPVSAVTGDGIGSLLDHLVAASGSMTPRGTAGRFRMAVDRAFDIVGAGFVVTGTIFSGSVGVGDMVRVPGLDHHLRVRGIHAQNARTEIGRAGQRCAINLAGPDLRKALIGRGAWLAGEGVPAPVTKLDAELRVLAGAMRTLEHWTPVHVHLGAAETTGRVAVLTGGEIAAATSGLVQLVLDKPIGAVFGDRFIVRDQSARATLGGGHVIDIFPPRRGRARPERLARLRAGSEASASAALEALLALSPHGIDLDRFAANRNLTLAEMADIERTAVTRTVAGESTRFAFSPDAWRAVRARALARLEDWHKEHPGSEGLAATDILAGKDGAPPADVQRAVAGELVREGALAKTEFGLRLAAHQARLAPADATLWETVGRAFDAASLRPLTVRELAEASGLEQRRTEALLTRIGRLGLVHYVSKTRVARTDDLQRLAHMVEEIARSTDDSMVGVAQLRDASGIGRNMSVEVMEFFDKQRFTQRIGDRHRVVKPAESLFR
jgi:selenocysteine-specific elongation factor